MLAESSLTMTPTAEHGIYQTLVWRESMITHWKDTILHNNCKFFVRIQHKGKLAEDHGTRAPVLMILSLNSKLMSKLQTCFPLLLVEGF